MATVERDDEAAAVENAGATGNARLTGMAGAVLFALLAAEGITILRVHSLLNWHVFIGMLLVPVVVLKMGSTAYRFARYYTGNHAYVRKGPPPLLLRLAGPFVVLLTVAVFATGIALVKVHNGPSWLLFAHKASFVLWFGAMSLHVLGHLLETPHLALADWSRHRYVPGANVRAVLLVGSLVVGIALAIATRSWSHSWQTVKQFG